MDRATVVILGGGVGGLVAAHKLRKALPRAHRVVLVEREASFVFAPSLLWVLAGTRTVDAISRPLDRLARKGIEVVRGDVRRIDPAKREVEVDGRAFAADFLIVALGAELAPEAVPGLAAAGHSFYSVAGATALRDAAQALPGGRVVVLTAAPAYKCPAAPYEAAMLLEWVFRKRKVREKVQIDIYAAEAAPMGVAGPEVSAGVREMVASKNIAYHPEHQVAEADPATRRLKFTNGATAEFDLLAFVAPHRAPTVVREAGLVGEAGWVPVDRHSMATRFARVFALGDVTTIPLAMGKPLPKAGVFAHAQAEAVAANLAREVTGKGKPAAFDGEGECFLETGDGKAAFGKGKFYADPKPVVKLHKPGRHWHAAKALFEKDWLRRWF